LTENFSPFLGRLADVGLIHCFKFCVDRFRDFRTARVEFCHSPLT